MKSFKSFRIDDILVNTSKSDSNKVERYKDEKSYSVNGTTSEELYRSKILSENRDSRKVDNDQVKWNKEDFHSPIRESQEVSESEVKVHSDIPRFAQFPLSQVPVEKSQSYPTILPYYPVDQAFRISQNRSLLKHYASASHIFSFPTFSPFHRGHYGSSGIDYAIAYPGLSGQYGIPLPHVVENRDGLYEKGAYTADKGHYSMYSLSRPMYAASCKRKGGQIRFNNSQTGQLEKAFVHQKYLNASERKKLAQELGLTDRQIKTWFQNRRAKLRKSKGAQCGDMEIPGSPDDHIDTSSQYADSPYDIQIAD